VQDVLGIRTVLLQRLVSMGVAKTLASLQNVEKMLFAKQLDINRFVYAGAGSNVTLSMDARRQAAQQTRTVLLTELAVMAFVSILALYPTLVGAMPSAMSETTKPSVPAPLDTLATLQ